MRERFNRVRRGQALSARLMSRVAGSLRYSESGAVGAAFGTQQTTAIQARTMQPVYRGEVLEITRVESDTEIYAKPLYYDPTTATWKLADDGNDMPVDHSLFLATPDVGDHFAGWWHDQRHSWVPLMGTALDKKRTCIDIRCEDVGLCSDSEEGVSHLSQVQWALERRLEEDNEETWWKINNRKYLVYLSYFASGIRFLRIKLHC